MTQAAPSDKSRRWWRWLVPRFSLRAILLLVTVICVIFGTIISRAERQRIACEELSRHGWKWLFNGIDRDYRSVPWETLSKGEPWLLKCFPRKWRTSHGLHYWRSVDTVYDNLSPSPASEILPAVSELPALRSLSIFRDGPPGKPSIWPRVGSLRTLRELRIFTSKIDDEGVAHLKRLSGLRRLDLSGTIVGDEGVKHLASLGSLEVISLEDTNITDQSIDYLVRMPRLRWLDLSNTRVTPEAINRLTRHHQTMELTANSVVAPSEFMSEDHVAVEHPWKNYARTELKLNRPLDEQILNLTIDAEIALTPERLESLSNVREIQQLMLRGREIGDEQLASLKNCREIVHACFDQTCLSHEGFRWLGKCFTLRELIVVGSPVTAEDVAQLAKLKELDTLTICDTPVDIATLREILSLPHIEYLELSNCPLPPEAVEELAGCEQSYFRLALSGTTLSPEAFLKHWPRERETHLVWDGAYVNRDAIEWLNLQGRPLAADSVEDVWVSLPVSYGFAQYGRFDSLRLGSKFFGEPHILTLLSDFPECLQIDVRASDAGAATMDKLASNRHLMSLLLANTNVSDGDLRHALGWTCLCELDLANCPITDAGVAHLESCWRMERLNLDKTGISDESIKTIATMKRLRSLSLRQTNITDAALPSLERLKNLQTLRLSGTRITEAALAEFERRRPECKVEYVGAELYETPRFRTDE